ncbi:HAD family hydrolase [Gammaproteobacteria bacterium]|nr:HAD family hydrolase [Gammaproteobacteria bacterium]
MILIFDLDDTLYPEITYVESGLMAVSQYVDLNFGLNQQSSFLMMRQYLKNEGRGRIFDQFLTAHNIFTQKNVKKCISIYRKHVPDIKLYPDAENCLNRFKSFDKYIITDGNITAQRNKIKSLGLKTQFKKIIPTYQYGISHSKPSILCFNMIMKIEKCEPSEMVYIGDNPHKDFVNIKKIGLKTIRVLRGPYRDERLTQPFEADFQFKNLNKLTHFFLRQLDANR